MERIAVTEKILSGRCHACSGFLHVEQVEGTESFLEEYASLNPEAEIVPWDETLLDGSNGSLLYRCESCDEIYTVLHRLGSNQEELTYQRGSGKERYYEHWILLDHAVIEKESE